MKQPIASDRFRGMQIPCEGISIDSTSYRDHARRALGLRLAVPKMQPLSQEQQSPCLGLMMLLLDIDLDDAQPAAVEKSLPEKCMLLAERRW